MSVGDDAAVGARLQVDLLGEAAAILERVADEGRLHPASDCGTPAKAHRPRGECPARAPASLPCSRERMLPRIGIGRRVPARGAQAAEQRGLRRCLVEMEGLRIELARKGDDVVPAEGVACRGRSARRSGDPRRRGRHASGCRRRAHPTGWRSACARASAPVAAGAGPGWRRRVSWLVRQLAATSPF